MRPNADQIHDLLSTKASVGLSSPNDLQVFFIYLKGEFDAIHQLLAKPIPKKARYCPYCGSSNLEPTSLGVVYCGACQEPVNVQP